METVVYRKIEANAWTKELRTSRDIHSRSPSSVSASAREAMPFSPELFYPLVTTQEMVTWTHWLPTALVFDCTQELSYLELSSMLRKLSAPPEVLEELDWSWKMELFDTYEVRTPVRLDARDPLLLGRLGEQRYRIALWGESLRPQEEITALVQQSLAIRTQAARWQTRLALAGALFGFALGVWLGYQSPDNTPIVTGFMFALLGVFFGCLPMLLYTPENRQHDFLDCYRG
jgi:hypothetical protein